MTDRKREIAKFFCGFEAFHAIANGYYWVTGMSLPFMGISFSGAWMVAGFFVHSAIAIVLGLYGWRTMGPRPSGGERG